MVRVRQSQIQDAGAAPEQVILLPDGSVLNSPDAFSLRTQFLEGSIRQSDYLERLSRLVRKEERIEEKSIRLSQKSSKSSDRPSSIIVTIIDEVIENPQPVDPELPALEASSSNSHIEIHDNINDDENNNAGDDLIVEVSSQQTAVSEPSPVSEPVPKEKVTDFIELYDTRIFHADDDDDDDDNCSSQASVDYPDIPPSVAESSNPHIEVISEHALHADDDEEIECSICWAASSRFYTLSCQHQYCMECLDELIRVAISQCFGAIPKVVCPQPNCGTLLSAQEIQEIASHQVGRQFVYFQMKGEAKDFKNLHNCAVSTCEGVLLPTDLIADTQLIPCRLCGINHCANCFHPQHDNKTCKQAHSEYKERVRKNSAKYQKAKAFRKKIRVGFKAILPTIATKTTMLINPNAKMCPNCFTWIVKRGGCHHMSCAHCHTSFCWDCRSPYHRPHCIINAILFPVAFPVAVAAVAAYTGLAIVPWVSLLGLSKLKATLRGRPWNPSKAFGSSAMMIYHIGNYIAPFPYAQMWH